MPHVQMRYMSESFEAAPVKERGTRSCEKLEAGRDRGRERENMKERLGLGESRMGRRAMAFPLQ